MAVRNLISPEKRRIAALCRERATTYGALRQSSTTAIALDRAAALLEYDIADSHYDDAVTGVEKLLPRKDAAMAKEIVDLVVDKLKIDGIRFEKD